MASRPRRSAATKATESISVQSKWADGNDTSERNTMPSRRSGRAAARDASSPESQDIPSSRSRQAARSRRSGQSDAGENTRSQRSRGAKKNYVIDSSPDDDDEDIEDEVEVELDEDEAMDDGDEDAEGEEEMDVDAEGEDAEGDVDMDTTPRKRGKQTIKVNSRSARSRPAPRAATSRVVPDDDDDDDDELSDPADSDLGDGTGFGDETMADQDAEGEEIEVAGDGEDDEEDEEEDEEGEDEEEEEEEDEEGEEGQEAGEGEELDSDEDGSRAGTPDLAKMTKRQRARFEEPQEYMKLSDEVQAKKVFTAEELSMRRQEMARRRRNLSEKRNEEVKMETINKLLKKQAPKVNKKAAAMRDTPDADERPRSTFIRWVSTKSGSKVAVPEEIIAGPVGDVFTNGVRPPPKAVEEVA